MYPQSDSEMPRNAELFAHLSEWTEFDNEILAELPWEIVSECVRKALGEWTGMSAAVDERTLPELEARAMAYMERIRQVPPTLTEPSPAVSPPRSEHVEYHLKIDGVRWLILRRMVEAIFGQGLPALQVQQRIMTLIRRAAYDEMAEEGAQLVRLAFLDVVTGLPNRLATQRYIENLVQSQQSFVVFYLDMDEFKSINDTYGHAAGDQVLRAVAGRWKNLLRRTDWLGRWGGDEFLMIIPDVLPSDALWRFAVRIRQTCEDAITLGGADPVTVSASSGYACFPEEGDSLEKILDRADRRLYRAKLSGLLNSPDTGDVGNWREAIQQALEDSRIEVHYQPIVHSKDAATAEQWEALVRFRDTDGQIHCPSEFLALLSPDSVSVLDRAVMRQVFADVSNWKREGGLVRVSINIDPWDLLGEGWIDQLKALHTEFADVYPADISFEIRESLTPFGIRRIVESLVYLNRAGYQVALDDFGSGISSLNWLQELPISTIKIDASLIKKWNADQGRILIQSVISLSGPMGFRVVAEGIENSSQRDALVSWGCDVGQGWFYGAAMPATEVLAWTGVPPEGVDDPGRGRDE